VLVLVLVFSNTASLPSVMVTNFDVAGVCVGVGAGAGADADADTDTDNLDYIPGCLGA
jgi:phosphoribosylaminoimidazole (AIR) synthetase